MTVLAMPLRRTRAILAAAVFAVGCGSESAERVLASAPVDTVRMQLSWEVSEGKHPTADSLGDLSGIAVDRGFLDGETRNTMHYPAQARETLDA